jgi:hypothetical protein
MLFFKLTFACVLVTIVAVEINPTTEFKSLWSGLSAEQKKDVTDIVKDTSLTKAGVKKKVEGYLSKTGDQKIKVINHLFYRNKYDLECMDQIC